MKIDIKYIKRTHRFPIRFIDFLNCLFLILPLVLLGLATLMIRSYNINNMTGLNGLLVTALIIGLIGLTMIIFILIRLNQNIAFETIKTGQSEKRNIEIAEKVFIKLYGKQFIDKKGLDSGLIMAKSNLSGLSWGELNSIICCDKEILINSRPTWQPVTLFENRLNLKRIKREIDNEIKPSPQHFV